MAMPRYAFLCIYIPIEIRGRLEKLLAESYVNYRLSKRGKRRDLFWTFEAYGRQDAPPCIISRPYRF
uniref:Uncharacterized protein n=1 Tax=Oryza rufipogon TaxID=4529 RepID=A0A0E0MQQ3_ORYRU